VAKAFPEPLPREVQGFMEEVMANVPSGNPSVVKTKYPQETLVTLEGWQLVVLDKVFGCSRTSTSWVDLRAEMAKKFPDQATQQLGRITVSRYSVTVGIAS